MASLIRSLFALIIVIAFAGCGFTKSRQVAERYADEFHQRFNESKFTEIYAGVSSAFKSVSKEADFNKFITAVRVKLGAFKSASQSGWNVNSSTNGTHVVLNYQSTYERGTGNESFTFVISGDTAFLESYNINSRELIIN